MKVLLSPPPGGYLISDLPEGGSIERRLIREGAYSQNQETRIYLVAFQFFYPISCGINITYNFTTQIHRFNAVFIPNHTKINMQNVM